VQYGAHRAVAAWNRASNRWTRQLGAFAIGEGVRTRAQKYLGNGNVNAKRRPVGACKSAATRTGDPSCARRCKRRSAAGSGWLAAGTNGLICRGIWVADTLACKFARQGQVEQQQAKRSERGVATSTVKLELGGWSTSHGANGGEWARPRVVWGEGVG
jgi:hypothetical protein